MKQLYTIWGKELDRDKILPEHPRPTLKRGTWVNLNGPWDYAFTKDTIEDSPGLWRGTILVPFSPESVLSKVNRQLKPNEFLWYHRELPEAAGRKENSRILLHFGAVDQSCLVYINGKEVCHHVGGYLPFDVDITDYLYDREQSETEKEEHPDGIDLPLVDEIVVRVRDVSDQSYHARGKQKLKRGGMYYTATSGIWQTVWMEEVPAAYVESLEVEPDPKAGTVDLIVHAGEDMPVSIIVHTPELVIGRGISESDDKTITQQMFFTGKTNEIIRMRIPHPHFWSPDEPWLYHFDVKMGEDMVSSYFAFRSISVRRDKRGIPRLVFNRRSIYMKGVLDQGYWPDGLYTAPADAAMLFDLEEMKKFGFNMVRKHAKIEPERWYYHCDQLGLLVWQDMVNGGEPYKDWYVTYAATPMTWAGIKQKDTNLGLLSRRNEEGREEFRKEIRETVRWLKGHPSIVSWTLFNEGWGQFETEACLKILREEDPTRPVDAASGWFDQGCGDFKSVHFYFLTFRFKPEKKRAFVLSEFGGIPMEIEGHCASEESYGYGQKYKTREELTGAYDELVGRMEKYVPAGLCATVYTQWTDIEDEVNGIYTWDRKVKKIHGEDLKKTEYVEAEIVDPSQIPVTQVEEVVDTTVKVGEEPEDHSIIEHEEGK